MLRRHLFLMCCLAGVFFASGVTESRAQLASKKADEWVTTLEGPQRLATQKIPEVLAKLRLKPGMVVADIGAGSGLFSRPCWPRPLVLREKSTLSISSKICWTTSTSAIRQRTLATSRQCWASLTTRSCQSGTSILLSLMTCCTTSSIAPLYLKHSTHVYEADRADFDYSRWTRTIRIRLTQNCNRSCWWRARTSRSGCPMPGSSFGRRASRFISGHEVVLGVRKEVVPSDYPRRGP